MEHLFVPDSVLDAGDNMVSKDRKRAMTSWSPHSVREK